MPDTDQRQSAVATRIDGAMEAAESAVYAIAALLLIASALVALTVVGHDLLTGVDDGAVDAVTSALDGLLLVFILVELLGAVRATVAERQLVAEPFLVVGMIASIKEIVVVSLKASSLHGDAFTDAMTEIGVLAGVVLLLALGSFLVRRKEREPTEGDP
jgi:LPXTG-motif cell wall-anchored protein